MDTTKTRPEGEVRRAERPQGQRRRPEAGDPPVRKKAPQKTEKKAPQKKRTGFTSRQRMTEEERRDTPNKKRAYGRSKPKKRSAVAALGMAVRETAKENAARRKARAERSGKKRPKAPTPAIIYTQPQVFNRNRLMAQLLIVLAVVLALVMGMNVFFKVGDITVTGADVYTPSAVKEASGIKEGDSLFSFSRARAGALIIANLPYVKNVSFGIKLPETVNIIIEEEDVVYSIQDQNGQWWLMNSEGRVVTMIKEQASSNYTQVLGVNLLDPANGLQAQAAERPDMMQDTAQTEATDSTASTQESIAMGTTGAQRLSVALEILKALEDNDIVGSAASVDVSQLEEIILWYGTRYQVNLGDNSRLNEKIDYMNDVIAQMSDYQSGMLDISFRIWTDQVGYTPFS